MLVNTLSGCAKKDEWIEKEYDERAKNDRKAREWE